MLCNRSVPFGNTFVLISFFLVNSPVEQLVPPVVIISACGLLLLGQFARFTAMTGRVRNFHKERLENLVRLNSSKGIEREVVFGRCNELEHQARDVLNLAKVIRNALLALVASVMMMLVSSLMIGLSTLEIAIASSLSVLFFVLGLIFMLIGMGFVFWETVLSMKVISREHGMVNTLAEQVKCQINTDSNG